MLLKISRCKLCFVGCVGGGRVLLSSSHCKRIPQSRCLPDVKLTFSILLLCNCEDDSHLEYHASDQHKDSLKFVEKQVMVFLHMLTVYQSPALYAGTMLHEHLVDFSPIHVCWCLHFSELLAGILSSSKTLKPLQLVHHSMPTSSLLGHLSASECLLVIGAKVIGVLFSPLGSQSRSEWKGSQSTSTASTAAGPSSIWNSSEHHILWYLTWEQFFSVGIKILAYLTWVALTFCLKQG